VLYVLNRGGGVGGGGGEGPVSSERGTKRPPTKVKVGSSWSTLRTAAQAWGCSLQALGSMAASAKTQEHENTRTRQIGKGEKVETSAYH